MRLCGKFSAVSAAAAWLLVLVLGLLTAGLPLYQWMHSKEEIAPPATIACAFMLAGYVSATAYCWLLGFKYGQYRPLHSLHKYGNLVCGQALRAGNENSHRAHPDGGYFDESIVSCAVCGGVTGVYMPTCIHCGSTRSVLARRCLDIE